jgi:hypothetical protein
MRNHPLRTALLTVGTLALALTTTAATGSTPVSTTSREIGGRTAGEWDLPQGREQGFAAGVLVDAQTGRPAFHMRAQLIETPSTSLLGQSGTLRGRLARPNSTGTASRYPIYTVNGSWRGSRMTGAGSFVADIFVQRSPLGPIVQIGRMGGDYRDGSPIAPSIRNPVGRYRGKWQVRGL